MRLAIGILLLLNLGVLLWQEFSPPDPGNQTARPEPEVGDLRLWSERKGQSVPEPSGITAGPPADGVHPATRATSVLEASSETETENKVLLDEAKRTFDSSSPALPGGGSQGQGQTGPGGRPPVAGEVVLEPRRHAMLCWEIGDYPGESQANTAAGALPAGWQSLGAVKVQLKKSLGFHALIPTGGSPGVAEAHLDRLTEQGVVEARLLASGPLKNAISLGLFDDRNKAELQARRVRAMGYAVAVVEKTATEDVYRLHIQGQDTQENLDALKAIGGDTGKTISCP